MPGRVVCLSCLGTSTTGRLRPLRILFTVLSRSPEFRRIRWGVRRTGAARNTQRKAKSERKHASARLTYEAEGCWVISWKMSRWWKRRILCVAATRDEHWPIVNFSRWHPSREWKCSRPGDIFSRQLPSQSDIEWTDPDALSSRNVSKQRISFPDDRWRNNSEGRDLYLTKVGNETTQKVRSVTVTSKMTLTTNTVYLYTNDIEEYFVSKSWMNDQHEDAH